MSTSVSVAERELPKVLKQNIVEYEQRQKHSRGCTRDVRNFCFLSFVKIPMICREQEIELSAKICQRNPTTRIQNVS